jgi:hypothetical protein
MDELYKVGDRMGQDQAGLAGSMPGGMPGSLGPGGGGVPAGMDMAALEEMLAGGGDIEQYLQSYEQMLSEGMNAAPQMGQVDPEGGVTVRPEPGFVIKTRDVASGMKVFLNVVANEHVEAPHMKSFAEMEGEQGCRVPLSIGNPVEDFDKKNEPCVSYDLVANPEVVKECKETPVFRDTVAQLCLAAIAQKYKIELDPKYKLPKMNYKGDQVQVQRIRVQKQSQIQEVGGSAPAPGGYNEKAEKEGGPPRPDFCIFYENTLSDASISPTFPDGFDIEWGQPPEDSEDAERQQRLNGFDLPCWRVNGFQERIRGTMRNKKEREAAEEETSAENSEAPADRETRLMLRGRTCVVQVRMDNLDRQIPSLKQFGLEVSDECLRIVFPQLPRQTRCAYAPLVVWWPRHFCSAQATADWDSKADTLTVWLPTEAPHNDADVFDQELLDAVF